MSTCILCGSDHTTTYYESKLHLFMECKQCTTIYRHPSNYITSAAEKERYLLHNNDVNDKRYQDFVTPLTDTVSQHFNATANGLDFGAGTGPVAAKLLTEKGHRITLYDPFFHPNEETLQTQYDFIICCEVIEHFHDPLKEFGLLRSLLKPNGNLYCMTHLWNGTPEAFHKWYYKDDPTHTIFYNKSNLALVAERSGFENFEIDGRTIVFKTA